MKRYGVIMAGGGGTRFWPLSRRRTPKQLLNLTGKELMINESIDRLSRTVDKRDIFVVTNTAQAEIVREVTGDRIVPNHILSEPVARNTAACVGYAAMEIIKKYGDGVMVITPSDAYIEDIETFSRTLCEAVKAAEEQGKLVTIGIAPTFPMTGYGYIKFDKKQDKAAKSVVEFKEKPDEETAKLYLASKSYLWNSGIFIWKASVILDKFRKFVPDIYFCLDRIGNAMGKPNEYEVIREIYPEIRKISIDYAIMEKAALKGDVLVVPGEFGWNDVGSWDMIGALHEADKNGNISVGKTVTIDTTDSIIYSSNRLVTLLGVDNLVVVETADVIMVCRKDRAQDVKLIVDKLNEIGREEFL